MIFYWMERDQNCQYSEPIVREIITSCWHPILEMRPSFKDILNKFESTLSLAFLITVVKFCSKWIKYRVVFASLCLSFLLNIMYFVVRFDIFGFLQLWLVTRPLSCPWLRLICFGWSSLGACLCLTSLVCFPPILPIFSLFGPNQTPCWRRGWHAVARLAYPPQSSSGALLNVSSDALRRIVSVMGPTCSVDCGISPTVGLGTGSLFCVFHYLTWWVHVACY